MYNSGLLFAAVYIESVCLWIWGGQNNMFTSAVLCSGTQQPSLRSCSLRIVRERRGKFPTFKVFMWHNDKQHNQFDWQSTQVENARAKLLLIPSDCLRSVFFSTVSRLRHTLCALTRPPSPFWGPFERSWWTKPFQGCNRWTLSGSSYHQNALRHSVFLWKEGAGIVNDEAWCLSDAKLSRFKCCSRSAASSQSCSCMSCRPFRPVARRRGSLQLLRRDAYADDAYLFLCGSVGFFFFYTCNL